MILLTGNKGYIGSCLHKVYPNAQTFDENRSPEKWYTLFARTRISDTIIHAGAIANMFYEEPDIIFWNFETTREIANKVAKTDGFLIFLSSCAAIEPTTHYGWSKRVAEDYIRATVKKYCILRLYNVYGDEENRPSRSHSTPERIKRRSLQYVFHPFRRDYIHVTDVVSAIQHAEKNNIVGTYDVGTGIATETKDLVRSTDCGFYSESTPEAVLGKCLPIEIKARKEHMLPDFQPTHEIFREFAVS